MSNQIKNFIQYIQKLYNDLFCLDHGAEVGDKTISGNTPLHWAAFKGNLELCKLLVEGGAVVDVMNDFGWKPIHDADHCGHAEVVKFLQKHGE